MKWGPDIEDIPKFTEEEVERATIKKEKHKAREIDGFRSDIVNLDGQSVTTRQIPESWLEATIIILLKKGDPKDIKNHRPSGFLSRSSTRHWQTGVGTNLALDSNQPTEQASFQKGFFCLEKNWDNQKYTKILQNAYIQARARIHSDNVAFDKFSRNRAARWADPMSRKLFTAVIEEILKMRGISEGINVHGEHLTNLSQRCCSIHPPPPPKKKKKKKEIERHLNRLNSECLRVGLNTQRKDKLHYELYRQWRYT